MANTALAVGTKIVNAKDQLFRNMTPDQFQSFLPLVSDCLEKLILSHRLVPGATLDTFSSITTFRALRALCFTRNLITYDPALFSVLDRCPQLKVLTSPIHTALPTLYDTHGPYAVQKLTLWGRCVADPRLVAFLECFPDLTTLTVDCSGYFTASCISWVMEKYASKLHKFELLDGFGNDDEFSLLPFGAGTGIQTCSNLNYLSLHKTNFISDVFMGALTAGCHKLETLHICSSNGLTNGGLSMLTELPNLIKLKISCWSSGPDLSVGVAAIAQQGRLIRFAAGRVTLSSACLKTIVRHCRSLKRLNIYHNRNELTVEDAAEIIHLYGIWGMEPRFMFRHTNAKWHDWNVQEIIKEIEETHQRHFEIYIYDFPDSDEDEEEY